MTHATSLLESSSSRDERMKGTQITIDEVTSIELDIPEPYSYGDVVWVKDNVKLQVKEGVHLYHGKIWHAEVSLESGEARLLFFTKTDRRLILVAKIVSEQSTVIDPAELEDKEVNYSVKKDKRNNYEARMSVRKRAPSPSARSISTSSISTPTLAPTPKSTASPTNPTADYDNSSRTPRIPHC